MHFRSNWVEVYLKIFFMQDECHQSFITHLRVVRIMI